MDITQRDGEAPYPSIGIPAGKSDNTGLKVLSFVIVIISILILTINILTGPRNPWSVIPISSLWLSWLVIGVPVVSKRLTPLMMFCNSAVIGVFLILISLMTGNYGWAIGYAVPFILMGSGLIITIIVLIKSITWKEFYLFQATIIVVSLVPIVIRLFIQFVLWPSLFLAIYGLITVWGMVIFGDKKFKYETRKRLHL